MDPPSTPGRTGSLPVTPPKTTRSVPGSLSIRVSHKVLVLGDYETGKTTLAKSLLLGMPRWLAFDPRGDVLGRGRRTLGEVRRDLAQGGKAIYQPPRGNMEASLNDFCELALTQSELMVFVDEPSMAAEGKGMPQAFKDLHRLGHARGLGAMVATHTIWDLPHVAQQSNHLFIFKVDRPVELNALGQVVGQAAIEYIQAAPKFHCWHKGAGHEGPIDTTRRAGVTPTKPPAA
jgi:hypothetical protein